VFESTNIRVCENVTVRPGVQFAAVTLSEADDPICRSLSAGIYPLLPLIELLEALAPRGGRVLDLGAHVGTFTLAAAALGYEVLGVEASPSNASVLQASLDRNGFERVRLVHAAVSNRPGTLKFRQLGPYGHVAAPGSGLDTVTVPALAVDDLLDELGWDRVDFIKMDIEGSEVFGLQGMTRRLGRADAPPLFFESNGHTLAMFGQSPASLKTVLESFGYHNYLVETGRLRPVQPCEFQPTVCVDYLALKGAPRLGDHTWRIDTPLKREEVVERVLNSCRSTEPAERGYIARALADADTVILSQDSVREAVRSLRSDEGEAIRTAASSVKLPPAWRTWIARHF
jgi:FkbM family methyltransferase